jgi:hypothetical protein
MQFIIDKVPKGMFRFEIGIQTVNQKANLEVSRKQNFDKTAGVINALKNHVEMHLDLIVGLALDYFEDIKYSFEEVFKLYPPELQLGFLKFLKGTPLREKHHQHGFVFDPIAPYQIIKSDYLSEQELADIVKLEHALEIYWNKKRIPNTLIYVTENYAVFDFLLGLGKYFGERSSYFKYTFKDIYDIVESYVNQTFPDDKLIKQFLAIDFYSQHKIKPGIKFVEEIERKEKNEIINQLKLDHHKNRHIMIPIDFDFAHFQQTNKVDLKTQQLVFEYTGTSLPKIFS